MLMRIRPPFNPLCPFVCVLSEVESVDCGLVYEPSRHDHAPDMIVGVVEVFSEQSDLVELVEVDPASVE